MKNNLYKFFNAKLDRLPPKKHNSVLNGCMNVGLESFHGVEYKFYFVCLGEKKDSLYWLRDWLDIFINFNVNFLVILRSKELQNWILANYPLVDSVTVNGFQAAVDLHKVTPHTKLVLYPINSMYNHIIIRLTLLRHVFIGHGDSDKLSSANKALRVFDEIWCSGQAQIDRMLNQSFNCSSVRFRKVGRPGLVSLLSSSESRILNTNKVLYLPTWEGSDERWDYCSVYKIDEILNIVTKFSDLTVSIRLHPFTGRRIKKLHEKIMFSMSTYSVNDKIKFVGSQCSLAQLLGGYDYFICDVSSVVTECLVVNRPIFLYQNKSMNVITAESNMSLNSFCYVFSNATELYEKISLVIHNGNDYKAEKRIAAAEYFVGLEATKNAIFEKILLEQIVLD